MHLYKKREERKRHIEISREYNSLSKTNAKRRKSKHESFLPSIFFLVLEKLEMECNLWSYKVVHRKLSELKGFGPFVVATILMCMGCYEKVPVDSETKRHLNQVCSLVFVHHLIAKMKFI